MEDKLPTVPSQEQEIDLIGLIKNILKDWRFILKGCIFGLLLGLVVGFSAPKEYVTEVRLAPEMTDVSAKGNLGGLAAMAGINLNTSTTGDAFSPDLYPDIVKSTPFLLELLPMQVTEGKNKNTYSLFEYIDQHQKNVWWNYIIKSPFYLLRWIQKNIQAEELSIERVKDLSDQTIFMLDREQSDVLRVLQERIFVTIDKKTSVMSIGVQMQDPLISAQLTQVIWENLQEYIITYRTQKARQDLDFTEKVYEEAKSRYFEKQREYATFRDANKHISTATYQNEQERLQNEMNLAYSVYNSLAQKLEQDRLKVQEQTPVFALIEPVKVPLIPTSPRKVFILVGFMFLAGIFSIGYILIKEPIASIISELRNK